jgi:hypothetical protein
VTGELCEFPSSSSSLLAHLHLDQDRILAHAILYLYYLALAGTTSLRMDRAILALIWLAVTRSPSHFAEAMPYQPGSSSLTGRLWRAALPCRSSGRPALLPGKGGRQAFFW